MRVLVSDHNLRYRIVCLFTFYRELKAEVSVHKVLIVSTDNMIRFFDPIVLSGTESKKTSHLILRSNTKECYNEGKWLYYETMKIGLINKKSSRPDLERSKKKKSQIEGF